MGLEEIIFVIVYDVRVGGYSVSGSDPETYCNKWEDNYYCDSMETAKSLENGLRRGIMGDGFKPGASDPNHFYSDWSDIYLRMDKREIKKQEIMEKNGSWFVLLQR
ncbi:MAG: hypothetical protein NTZ02_00645, partial [Candidatus Woesearchaeota archaeon]|nr:hypothetical protein [Candidatus Woesearchaeota archaeon]